MINLSHIYPKLQYINHFFTKAVDSLEHDKIDNLVILNKNLTQLLIESFEKQDEEVFACIIHYTLEFTKRAISKYKIDKIGIFLKLESQEILDVVKMCRQNEESLLVHFLLNRFNFSKHALNFNKKKGIILPFRTQILKCLGKNNISTNLSDTPSLSADTLVANIKGAIKTNNPQNISYYIKAHKCLLDEFFTKGDAIAYAQAVYVIAKQINLLENGDVINSSYILGMVDLEEFEIYSREANKEHYLEWCFIYLGSRYENAREQYGMQSSRLIAFRKDVLEEILSLHSKAGEPIDALLPDFSSSLEELDKLILNKETNPYIIVLPILKCFAVLHQNIFDQNIDVFSENIQQFIEMVMKHHDEKSFRLLGAILNITDQDIRVIMQMVDHKLYGHLAWALISSTVELHYTAYSSGMNYEEYRNIKIKISSKLYEAYGFIVPTEEEFANSFVSAATNKISSEVKLNKIFNRVQYAMLIEETYLNKDVDRFVALISELAKIVSKNKTAGVTKYLIQLLDVKVEEMEELFTGINQNKENLILKSLADISLRKCYKFHPTNKRSSKPNNLESEQEYQKYKFSEWRRKCKRDNFLIPLTEFQIKIYKKLNLDYKEEQRGSIVPVHIWQWNGVSHYSVAEFKSTLDEYAIGLLDILQNGDFDLIKKRQALRRNLIDFAVFQNDIKLFASIISQDVSCLKYTWKNAKYAEVACLMFLDAKQINQIDQLFDARISEAELYFSVLDMLNLSYSYFAFVAEKSQGKAWNVKRQAYKALSALDAGCAAGNFVTFFPKYQQALLPNNLLGWDGLDVRISHMLKENIYKFEYNDIKFAKIFAAEFKLLLSEAYKAYTCNYSHISLAQICVIKGLDDRTVFALMQDKQLHLLSWFVLNNGIFKNFVEQNKLSLSKANFIKDSISMQLERLLDDAADKVNILSLPSIEDDMPRLGLLRSAKVIAQDALTVAEYNEITKLEILGIELHAALLDRIQHCDVNGFVGIVKIIAELSLKLYANKQNMAIIKVCLYHDDSYNTSKKNNIGDLFLALEQNELNRPLLTYTLLEKINIKYYGYFYDMQEKITEFMQDVYKVFDSEVLSSNQEIFAYGQKFHTQKYSIDELDGFARLVSYRLAHACKVYDAEYFAKLVAPSANLIRNAYDHNQLELVLRALAPTKKNISKLMLMLESNHEKGLQSWIIEHYIQKFKCNYRRYNYIYSDYIKDDKFIKEIHKNLGIEAFDLYLVGKTEIAKNEDYKELLESMRRLANTGVDLLKHQNVIDLVARVSEFHSLLTDYKPQDSDNFCYHRAYEVMQAIWQCHIVGHVYGVLKPMISLGDFQSKWEGSVGNTMIKYVKDVYVKNIVTVEFKEVLQKTYQRYFSCLVNEYSVDEMFNSLNKQITDSIILNKSLSSTAIDAKLNNGEVIAIPVHLLEIGANEGHLVSAVFFNNQVMFSDRGKKGFTGMQFYQINCLEQLSTVIHALVATSKSSIASTVYASLRKSLKLKQIDELYMPGQLMGNCGMSSSAEPIYVALLYYKFYQIAKKTGRNDEDSISLANHVAQLLHTKMMHIMQDESVRDLMAFFGDINCTIAPPRELLAHVYQMALYKFNNGTLIKLLNKSSWVDNINIEQAYDEIKSAIRMRLESSLPKFSRGRVCIENLVNEADRCLKLYLYEDLDTQDLIREFRISIGRLSADTEKGMLKLLKHINLREFLNSLTPEVFVDNAIKDASQFNKLSI